MSPHTTAAPAVHGTTRRYQSIMRERSLIYLACPYTKIENHKRAVLVNACATVAAVMMARGWPVFAPVVYGRQLAIHCGKDGAGAMLRTMPQFWQRPAELFLSLSSALIVYGADGWKRSAGVRQELNYARQHGLIVQFIWPSQSLDRIPLYTHWCRDVLSSPPDTLLPDTVIPPASRRTAAATR